MFRPNALYDGATEGMRTSNNLRERGWKEQGENRLTDSSFSSLSCSSLAFSLIYHSKLSLSLLMISCIQLPPSCSIIILFSILTYFLWQLTSLVLCHEAFVRVCVCVWTETVCERERQANTYIFNKVPVNKPIKHSQVQFPVAGLQAFNSIQLLYQGARNIFCLCHEWNKSMSSSSPQTKNTIQTGGDSPALWQNLFIHQWTHNVGYE